MTVTPQAAVRTRRPHWSLARTWLLQPGVPDGRDAFDAAVAGSADVVVLDIEDGLPDARKAAGRESVAEWLDGSGQAWVRINGTGTSNWAHHRGMSTRRVARSPDWMRPPDPMTAAWVPPEPGPKPCSTMQRSWDSSADRAETAVVARKTAEMRQQPQSR